MTDYYVATDATGGGSGTSTGDPFDLSEMWSQINSQASGNTFHVKAGTYVVDSTYLPFASGGNDGAVIRGYNTTPNDLSAKPTSGLTAGTDYPLFRITTASQYIGINGSGWAIESMGFQTDANRPAWYMRTSTSRYLNCSFVSTDNNNLSNCINSYGSRNHFIGCSFESTHVSSSRSLVVLSSHNDFYGCTFKHASVGECAALSGYGSFNQCVFIGGTIGISLSYNGSLGQITNNTFYNQSTAGLRYTYPHTDKWLCANNLFHSCATGIDFNGVTATHAPIINNSFYNCTTNIATHSSSIPALETIVESSDPLANAGTDFSLAAGSSSLESSYPYIYQLIDQRQYLDVGAVQKESTGGGGSVIVIED